jgi:hypothetical protein
LRETARQLETLNTLIQRAATPRGREDLALIRDLGAVSASLGHTAEARAWYGVAIARDPLDSESQRARFRLSEQDNPGMFVEGVAHESTPSSARNQTTRNRE